MASQGDHSVDSLADDEKLYCFCRLVANNEAYQVRLRSCRSPETILRFALELQAPFSRQTLRLRSRDLAAEYWPWAHKGPAWRRQFFEVRPGQRPWPLFGR